MLSTKIIKHFGIRVKFMVYTGLTIYSWDTKKSELIPPQYKWLYWNWNLSNSMGYGICLILCVYIYTKLWCEEDGSPENLQSFAVLVFTWGELIVIQVINLLASRIRTKQREIQYAINQMFKYHNQLSKWLDQNNIILDKAHQNRIQIGEIIIIGACYGSYVFPCLLFIILFHPLEPIHNMVLDWLEFEIALENMHLSLLFMVPPLFLSILAAGSTVIVMIVLVVCYYLVAVTALDDLVPSHVTQYKGSRRSMIQTEFYGEMEDKEIIERYRVQQLLNGIINDILASFGCSLHHVACLTVFPVCVFILIKCSDVLEETGKLGYAIVIIGAMLPLVVEYIESYILGKLADSSRNFKTKGITVARRRALIRVFARGCQTFHIETAYPYFRVDKSTFLDFFHETLDKTITLLLW